MAITSHSYIMCFSANIEIKLNLFTILGLKEMTLDLLIYLSNERKNIADELSLVCQSNVYLQWENK